MGIDQRYSGRFLRETFGALYMFPKIDAKRFNIHDDQKMVLDFLLQEKVLLVQGTAFNWPWPDHFRHCHATACR
ncbi:putative aminotransferase [Escherichia coli]|nr:putative aminotransferase [Escherichia coli]